MLLATQNNFAIAQNVENFDELKTAITQNTAVVVDLTKDINWDSDSLKLGDSGISTDITLNGHGKTLSATNQHTGFDSATGTTLTINDAHFAKFNSETKGGALFNAGTLNLNNVSFSNNTATSGNDIYNDNGSINMQGIGKIELNGGIAGTGSIVSSTNLILNSDNSGYTGTFEQTTRKNSDGVVLESGLTTVESGALFFGGTSNINAGSLIWNTANDISENAKLTINNASLTIGNSGQLTINSGSSVTGASSITTNGNLTLNNNAETVIKKLDGTGSITINGGSGLTINNSSNVGSSVKITSNGQSDNLANLNVIGAADNIINADSTIKVISNPNFMHLTLDNANVETSDLNLTTDGLAKVTTKNVTIKDGATLSLSGSSTLENDGALTIERAGELSDNSTIKNNKTLTLQGNGKLTSSSANSTIYNATDAELNVKADQSGFNGKFENYGTTNVDDSSMLFDGEKLISAGQMIIKAGTVTGDNYQNIQLINSGSLTQYITDTNTVGKIDDTVFSFNGSGNSANFITNGNTKGQLELISNIKDENNSNTISFQNDDVSLTGTTDFTGGTIYNFENSNINLKLDANGNNQNYNFSNITGSNNKLSFNIKIEDVAGANDGSKYIKTDTLTISGGDGSQKFDIGKLYLTGKENGWNETYKTNDGNVLTGASFNDIEDGKITLSTTSWIYDVTKNGDNTIQMTINNYASNKTLYNMNDTEGTRFFQFSDDDTKKDQTYNIGQSLGETKNGTFTVSGYGKDKCTISGKIIEGENVGTHGSFFDIKNDADVTLTIQDVTIADASKTTAGSVVNNESTSSTVNIINANIKDSSSNVSGGAIYNKGKLNILNTTFSGNSSGTSEAPAKGGAIYNDGEMTLTDVTLVGAISSGTNDIYQDLNGKTLLRGTNTINSSISGSGSIENEGHLVLNANNSEYQGTYTQKDGITEVNKDSTFFGGESTIENGTLYWNTEKDYDGTLKVNGGLVNIGNVNDTSLTLGDDSYIAKDAKVNLVENSDITLDGGHLTLDGNDDWKGDIFIGDEDNIGSGTLIIDGLTSNGGIATNGGTIDIVNGKLTAATNDVIKEATTVKIENSDKALLDVNGGDVTLGKDTAWASKGGVLLNGGTLTVKDFNSENGFLQANNGTLDINKSIFTIGENGHIEKDVITRISNTSNLKITDTGYVNINDNDEWAGKISLDGGTLNYGMRAKGHTGSNGTLNAANGNLNLLNGSYMDLTHSSKIEKAVAVDIQRGATVSIKNGTELNLDSNDTWAGLISNETYGTLKTDNVDSSAFGGQLQQNRGTSIFDNKSNIYIDGKDSYICDGTIGILNGSTLHIGSDVTDVHFFVNDLGMSADSTLDTMNNTLNRYKVTNDMTVNGKNNVTIDVDARNKIGDTFVVNNLKSDTNGILNISDFNFIGQAPIDRHIKFKVFDTNSIENVDFTATDKQIFTPIGYYDLQSAGGGYYTSNLRAYNPQVFRGQVATLASYNNQLVIDDMLLNHVTLDSERTLAQTKNANKYASTLPQFAPYQYKKEEGGLWYKSYVNFENLSLTQGLKVGNNSYGSLIGADFPVIKMKRGWRFMPTAYIGYNGAHQTFNGVGMYQNGGQGGFMGTFMKNDFIGSVLAYGGGYNNEMSVAGYTDRTGNWFAGTAAKLAYNLHPTKHFTIQPTAFVSYNIFGRQNWGTDYGAMSMNSGLMNGINIAPGMNFIYARETWSVYATFQYMYNINDQVGGKAGNVDLASVEMKHGYIQYGVGVTKTWKDRLNSFFQIVFRNGGRTGVGFQLGLNYAFDWLNPAKTKSTKAKTKKIKSTNQSLKTPQYEIKGSKEVIKSLSMK